MKTGVELILSKVAFWRGEGVINPAYDDGDPKSREPGKKADAESSLEEQEEPSREQWSSPVEFLLSCIAMSVGLGNIWRFPFTAYENGGGAFLIPYIIVLVFIGKPLYYLELCLGQFASFGPVKVWELAPAFKGVGYGQAVATWCVVTYYVSLMALTVYYFFASFSSVLPWATCPANITDCVDATTNVTGLDIKNTLSSAEIYFEKTVLNKYEYGLDHGIFAPDWRLSLCLLFSWIVLLLVLIKGVEGSGKAAYFTALFPYVVLFILLGRGASLPGAINGIKYFITPQWKRLLDPGVWYAAVGQSFFSLSVGFGSISMFASYNNFRHNVYRDAAIISVTDTLTSLLAGFTIFSILGHLAYQMDTDDVTKVIKGGGTSLAFVSYPDVLSRFDIVPQLFAVLFFLMLFTLGVGSAAALTGCIITIICDDFPKLSKPVVTIVVCIVGFLLGLFYVTPQGQHILTLVDFYGGTFIIYILAIMEIIAVQYVYGFGNLCRDIEFMLRRKTGIYWRFCWTLFIPILLLTVFIYMMVVQEPLKEGSYVFSAAANGFGIFLVLLACGMVPVFFVVSFFRFYNEGSSVIESLLASFRPTEEWGPKIPSIRKQYLELLDAEKPIRKGKDVQGIDNPIAIEMIADEKPRS